MNEVLDLFLAIVCAVLLIRWIYLSVHLFIVYQNAPQHPHPSIIVQSTTSKFYQKKRRLHWFLREPDINLSRRKSALYFLDHLPIQYKRPSTGDKELDELNNHPEKPGILQDPLEVTDHSIHNIIEQEVVHEMHHSKHDKNREETEEIEMLVQHRH